MCEFEVNLSLHFDHAYIIHEGHQEKPNVLAFHPQAKSLLVSAGYDCRILLWNLNTQQVAIELNALPQPVRYTSGCCVYHGLTILSLLLQLFALAWSPDGKQLATLCKDHVLRLYTPRSSTSPTAEGNGPEGSRGARIVWLDDTTLAVSGFDKYLPTLNDC